MLTLKKTNICMYVNLFLLYSCYSWLLGRKLYNWAFPSPLCVNQPFISQSTLKLSVQVYSMYL